MKEISSVVVAVDGESKCGKTTMVEAIAEKAAERAIDSIGLCDFKSIETFCAGNAFRAAALYSLLSELDGEVKVEFCEEDTPKLRSILEIEGIKDVLQEDPNIGSQVSKVGRFAGIQALCGAIFTDEVTEAYNRDGGGNLVIIDARNPIGTLKRNNAIGMDSQQIRPDTILSLYIDTPTDVAAERMSGDYSDNFAMVTERRELDSTRPEFPVTRPIELIDDFDLWMKQAVSPRDSETSPPTYCVENGRLTDLLDIRYIGGIVAAIANNVATSRIVA